VVHNPHLLGPVCHNPQAQAFTSWGTWTTAPV